MLDYFSWCVADQIFQKLFQMQTSPHNQLEKGPEKDFACLASNTNYYWRRGIQLMIFTGCLYMLQLVYSCFNYI